MIIITKDNISNYLTEKDINIIDKNINKKMYFSGLNELIKYKKYKKCKKYKKSKKCKIIYNQKYYFISYNDHNYNDKIILINNNNFNDIKIFIDYKNKDWDYFNIIKNIDITFYSYTNTKIIKYNYKTIEYNYEYNYKLIKIGIKVKKIFLNYYYIYNNFNNYSLYYYYYCNNFLFILKIFEYRNYTRIKYNLNIIIYNLLLFV